MLAQGYIDLGLCKGTLDEVLENGSYKQFYMHRAGHWLGLDVHDAGSYQVKGASQKLAPGMVLTVEPGTYIRPADNVPEHSGTSACASRTTCSSPRPASRT